MNSSIELNSEQIELLFRQHYEGLGRYAFSILKDQSAAEDVIQKLFSTLWEKRESLQIMDVKSYLYRAVHNFCLNDLKRSKHSNLHFEISDKLAIASTVYSNQDVLQNELTQQIENAIDSLPEKCGEVFRLSRMNELSYREISEKLDISIKTVENHMGKALKLMRIELKEYLTDILVIVLIIKGW
jgi:RNA polymerase sigma-70 factor (ECF subfamily)